MKRRALDHPKLLKLQAGLGMARWQVVGLVESLWLFTGLYAPTGSWSDFTAGDLGTWMQWAGPPPIDQVMDELVAVGLVDRCPDHGLAVHDWADHADGATKVQLKREGRDLSRQCCDEVRARPVRSGPVPSGQSKSVDRKRPTTPLPDGFWAKAVAKAATHGRTWSPRPGPQQAKVVRARLADGYTPEQLLAAIDGYMRRTAGMDNQLQHLTATSIYRPSNVEANVESSWNTTGGNGPSALERSRPRWNPVSST